MPRRELIPPPAQCEATSKRTGKRCRRHAVVGAKVCSKHGAYAGRNGRQAAEDLHAARRIEAQVTEFASRAMLAAGWPSEVVEQAGGRLPAPDPDEESTESVTEDDVEATVDRSMARLAESLTAQFQDAAVKMARQQAQQAASQPATLEGELAEPGPENGAQAEGAAGPVELDPVDEELVVLERRPTTARMAEAARLSRSRGVAQDPEPGPDPEPEPELADDMAEFLDGLGLATLEVGADGR